MTSLPVRQIEDPAVQTGEIFVLEREGVMERFLPQWGDDGNLVEDVGLIVRTPNPLNTNRSLTICNGIHILQSRFFDTWSCCCSAWCAAQRLAVTLRYLLPGRAGLAGAGCGEEPGAVVVPSGGG